MGKTSPLTGTGKKARKAEYKAHEFAAKEYVNEAKHDRGAKRSAKHDIRQIAKGKHLPETDIGKLTKQYQKAYEGTQGMFDAQTQEALHQFQTKIAPSVSGQFAGTNTNSSSAMRQALAASGMDLQRSLASDFANLRHGIASGTVNQSNQNTLSGLNARLMANQSTLGQPISPISGGIQNSYLPSSGGGVSAAGAGISGALAGAGTGAKIGSLVPGIGTAWGAGIGAGLGALGGLASR